MKAWSVTQINRYIKSMFVQDVLLSSLLVEGEVTNCKYHSAGHIYFTLKDSGGSLSCIMFAGNRRMLKFPMKDGDRVTVCGSVDVYERDGRYQLYAKEIRPAGAGELYERFLRLKAELEEMGMFDPSYKKPIPRYARTVGIVTAPGGAAVRDIQNIARRRNPFVRLILYPSLVQGDGAAESLVRGLEALDRAGVDVIIIGRGGGSYEDLQAFNEESVARAIFACGTPVISAVGHETDTTIADYTADLRAPTPSAAAELAGFDCRQFLSDVEGRRLRITRGFRRKLQQAKEQAAFRERRFRLLSPEARIRDGRRRLTLLSERLENGMRARIQGSRGRCGDLETRIRAASFERLKKARIRQDLLITRFAGASPVERLRQGYSYAAGPDGKAVTSIRQVRPGDRFRLYVTDGVVSAEVKETESYGGRE